MTAWLLAVVAVEAATELLVASDFGYPIRLFFSRWRFTNALTSCGYCASVWIAGALAWALPGEVAGLPEPVNIAIRILVLQRAANALHGALRLLNVRAGRG